MIDRYIYAVTSELPKKLREEIGNELKALIDNMMDEMDNSISEVEKIDEVLRELGKPRELANRYRGKERYLIGPSYFDKYISVMKIVVLSIFIGISIASGLGVIFSIQSIAQMVGGYISSLIFTILQGATWVTVIFALLEYKEISVETGKKQRIWEPSQLAELSEKKALISRNESVFSIIITTVFLPLFYFAPDLIGIYYKVGSEPSFIQLFNVEGLAPFRIIVFIVFTINILKELIKIIKGRWTINIAIVTSVLSVTSVALFIYTISNINILNVEIVEKFEQYTPISFEGMILLTTAVIIIAMIGESVSAIYKGSKYGGKKQEPTIGV